MSEIQDKDKLYTFLRPYVDWMFRRSYRSYHYVGKENIPTDGAVIFAPNHTNCLCDAMAILGIDRSRKVFVARADIFKDKKRAKISYVARRRTVLYPAGRTSSADAFLTSAG